MAEIGEAVLQALDGIAQGVSEPASPITSYRGRTARMRALENDLGGEQAAADAVGVKLRTWRKWNDKGARLAAASLRKLTGAAGELYKRLQEEFLQRFLRRIRRAPRVHARVFWTSSRGGYMPANNGWRSTTLHDLFGADGSALHAPWQARDAAAVGAAFERLTSVVYGRDPDDPDDQIRFEGDPVTLTW